MFGEAAGKEGGGEDDEAVGRLLQPAASAAAPSALRIRHRVNERRRFMLQDGSWIILLEMGVALCLAVFIVWWTMPRKKKPEDDKPDPDSKEKP
jgi:hypothetical protein